MFVVFFTMQGKGRSRLDAGGLCVDDLGRLELAAAADAPGRVAATPVPPAVGIVAEAFVTFVCSTATVWAGVDAQNTFRCQQYDAIEKLKPDRGEKPTRSSLQALD